MNVLYILGRGRSGSTVLANVLGEIPGFFCAGELRTWWDPVVATRSACGCGASVADCEIWSSVLDRLSDVDLEEVIGWQHEIVKESNLYRLLRKGDERKWAALRGYARVTTRLYTAIADVTGCTTIVDSSKRPSYGAFIRLLEDCETYFVHLARDPRASAYSWQSRRYKSAHGDEVRRRNALDSTLRWTLLNLGAETLLKRVAPDRRMQLRYEDFVAQPRATVQKICELVGETRHPLPFVGERTVQLGPNHTIAGNPSRFRTGRLEISDTQSWKTEQDIVSRWLSTVIALPYLRRYRYPIRI